MFLFNYADGASALSVWGVWIIVFVALFGFNEIARRWKTIGFLCFFYFTTNTFNIVVYSIK